MSLKSFHLVFIACSSALAFLFGAWVLRSGTLVGLPLGWEQEKMSLREIIQIFSA